MEIFLSSSAVLNCKQLQQGRKSSDVMAQCTLSSCPVVYGVELDRHDVGEMKWFWQQRERRRLDQETG
ncbi:uncharacterized protein FOMMEDRAFT_154912 [Fomitiporia mediterranea MF3/22]|uniref:uncharacterized protein n=1 Tax=Fomitiporia mediterranea (strain MF3/22) TaxID=694068 RepID=UPI0004408FEB|nr:uncharacterized protein FOMMEDRAFT_154912 [Fomitiporia mediterranea MF3/22]EJD03801.1 hypothetical protein FOMMEDRAFT_154912 [Fomitiporia mediterranea MF3/22]